MSSPPPYAAYPPQPQPYPPPQIHYPPVPGPPSTYPAVQGPYHPYTGAHHQTYGNQGHIPLPPQNVVYTDRTVVYIENRNRRDDDTAEKCCLIAMCAICLCCLLDG